MADGIKSGHLGCDAVFCGGEFSELWGSILPPYSGITLKMDTVCLC